MDRMQEKEVRRRRRIERQRMLRKARKLGKSWNVRDVEVFAQRNADNMKMCSCNMCRSPRRSFYSKSMEKLTMQERKFAEANEIRFGEF